MKKIIKINFLFSVISLLLFIVLLSNSYAQLNAFELVSLEGEDTSPANCLAHNEYVVANESSLFKDDQNFIENRSLESSIGFGCNDFCGAGRMDGYSLEYQNECRNWQVMPIISPLYSYWIDEESLSGLEDYQKERFINYVDKAATEWNSVRIADYDGPIVTLEKQSNNGAGVVPVRLNPNLDSDRSGYYDSLPLFHKIEIKNYNYYDTILHEFGHMLGLQDLDRNNEPSTHIALMGYAGNGKLCYQDIQGLAVANGKHTNHDFKKYWYDGSDYNYVCFYCDITSSEETTIYNGEQLEFANECVHNYQDLVSAGERYWQKCTECYKVIECEFKLESLSEDSTKIIGLIGERRLINIPKYIGNQKVVAIGEDAFLNNTAIEFLNFFPNNDLTTIGDSAFKGCINLWNVSLQTNLYEIGDSAFEGCVNLNSISIPNTVMHIGDSTFKGCTNLNSITLSSSLTDIGDSVFENCSSLTKINIPSSVISIGSLAFKNCTSLTEVTINRDENDITEIGISAFYGCTSLNNINVPSNRIFDYSNASNWKTYKSKITSNVSFDGIDINCYSNSNSTIMINPGEKGILKINVSCPKSYKITASSNNYIIFKLYDSYMREINIAPTSYDSSSGEINSYLTNGEYYISVEYTHPAIEGYALINIQQTYSNNNSFVYGSNNVLTHLHEINGELKNSSIYSNGYGRGLYKIIINGNLQSYQNVLTIYDDINKVEPMKRIETALYELDAKTTMISNNLVVYLNEGQSYYIDIAVPIGTYNSLTLTIERIEESIEVDLVHYEHENDGDPTNDNIIYEHIIMTDETQIGDHFVMLEILEPSSISVIYDYIGTQEEYIYFVLFKEVYDNNERKYKMQLVFPDMMVTYGESLEWKSSITAGRHYIGYFNKLNPDSIISISITR